MKRIVYLLAIMGAVFTGCNPLEDINNDIDSIDQSIVGEVEFTMSDEDYDELELNFGNFNSVEDAKLMIPGLLTDKYPVWGLGSSATVSFNVYAPRRDERSLIVYEVTTADYDANPDTAQFDNFDDIDQIYEFLNTKYPSPEDRVLVSLTYDYYDGSTNELNNGFLYLNGNWEFIGGITDDEYEVMGEGFPNFSNEDEAFAKIPIFLEQKFLYDNKVAGDIEPIMYKLYTTDEDDVDGDGSTTDNTTYSYVTYFIYDGAEWSEYKNEIEETVKFGHDGDVWVPDNTIRYTLSSDDVAYISNAFINIYPGPADNVGFFGSFDRRSSSPNYWSDDMLLEAMNSLLESGGFITAEEQKYVLTFVIYNGATGNESLSLIKMGGEWVLN